MIKDAFLIIKYYCIDINYFIGIVNQISNSMPTYFENPMSLGHTSIRSRVCIPVHKKLRGIPSPMAL